MRAPWLCLPVAVLALAACGPAERLEGPWASSTVVQGFTDAPEPPGAMAAVALTPCPPGWRELPGAADGEPPTCDPWPAGGPSTCGPDEAQFPGRPGCERVGTACPASGWPDLAASTVPVRYVKAGASAGGSGSKTSPFASITQALAGAPNPVVLALATGTYAEAVRLPPGVTLAGACVGGVLLAPATPGNTPVVTATGPGAVVKNLRIGGAHPGLWLDTNGASLEVHDVVISGAQAVGLAAFNAVSVTGGRLVVRGTLPFTPTGLLGQGLEGGMGASVELTQVSLESNRSNGVATSGAGTKVTLTDLAVRDTRCESTGGSYGRGLTAHDGAVLRVLRAVVETSRMVGINAETGSTLSLTDAVVRDTLPSTDQPDNGIGGSSSGGSTLELTRVLFERNRAVGLYLSEASTATLTDVVVRETQEQQRSFSGGHGILAGGGTTLVAKRLLLAANRKAGLQVEGTGTTARLEDALITRTRGQKLDGMEGQGLAVLGGGRLDVLRFAATKNTCGAVVADGTGSTLVLADGRVSDTAGCDADGLDGKGVIAQFGAAVSVTRVELERNRASALLGAKPGSVLVVTDVTVRDTLGEDGRGTTGGTYGEGLHLQEGASASVLRLRIERSHEVGLFVVGSTLVGRDVEVRDTRVSACPPERCLAQAGFGVVVADSASLALTRFVLGANATVGLQLVSGGTADLSEGEISDNPIGANVETVGFDLARLQHRVEFRRNTTNLDAKQLPLPPRPGVR